MADHVGEYLETYITVLDAAGNAVTGLVPVTEYSRDPDGVHVPFSYTEIGGGTYRAVSDAVATKEGIYFLRVLAGVDRYTATWDVDAAEEAAPIVPPPAITYPTTDGLTRRQIRRTIGGFLGDLIVLHLTQDSTTATTAVDRERLVEADNYYQGRQAYFAEGQVLNEGQIRWVQSSSGSQRSVTFTDALPVVPRMGDEIELTNWRGVGFLNEDYNREINNAIIAARASHYETDIMLSVTDEFNTDTRELTLPSNMVIVDGIDYLDADYGWTEIYPYRDGPEGGWELVRSAGVVQVGADVTGWLNGRSLRVRGFADPPVLDNDDDLCAVPTEWLKYEVAANLLQQSIMKNPGLPNRTQLYSQMKNRADTIRPLNFVRTSPFAVRVR